jgi:hypothetical protein
MTKIKVNREDEHGVMENYSYSKIEPIEIMPELMVLKPFIVPAKGFSYAEVLSMIQKLINSKSNIKAKFHVEAALKAASEDYKADIDEFGNVKGYKNVIDSSILNAYPLNLIK